MYNGSGSTTSIGTDSYLYDLEGRLAVSQTRGVTESYSYDAFGNLKSATGTVNRLGQTTCAQTVTIDMPTNTNRLVAAMFVRFPAEWYVTVAPLIATLAGW